MRLATQAGETAHADDEVHWRADGTSFPVEYWARPIERDGARTGAVVSFVDVSGRKRTEGELARYRDRLEDLVRTRTAELESLNRELESFSYSVSHDLRAPLRAIDGYAQILGEDYAGRLDANGLDLLERMRAGAQRMGQIIDDLLELSQVTRAEVRSGPVDLSATAWEIVAELASAEPGRDVAVEIAPGLRLRGDQRLLRIALTNLLDNAWKYTGPAPAPRIEVGAATIDGQRAYYVRDNGVGFDMKYAGKLFNAFQRLHGYEFPGTGIGLATVARIFQRHGGRVWAEGAAGAGATFWFSVGEAGASPAAAPALQA